MGQMEKNINQYIETLYRASFVPPIIAETIKKGSVSNHATIFTKSGALMSAINSNSSINFSLKRNEFTSDQQEVGYVNQGGNTAATAFYEAVFTKLDEEAKELPKICKKIDTSVIHRMFIPNIDIEAIEEKLFENGIFMEQYIKNSQRYWKIGSDIVFKQETVICNYSNNIKNEEESVANVYEEKRYDEPIKASTEMEQNKQGDVKTINPYSVVVTISTDNHQDGEKSTDSEEDINNLNFAFELPPEANFFEENKKEEEDNNKNVEISPKNSFNNKLEEYANIDVISESNKNECVIGALEDEYSDGNNNNKCKSVSGLVCSWCCDSNTIDKILELLNIPR